MTPHPRALRTDLPAADSPSAALPQIATGRLVNGLDVLVLPSRRSPVVTHALWYRNGAIDDSAGKSGTAHFLEHLMFKGTERYPAGHFSKALAAVGGEENAFTSWAYTCYHQKVPAVHLRTCMAYEADRMRGLRFDEAEIASERDVVLAERGMHDDSDPARLMQEALQAAAFPAHPCGRPIIGWRHEIETLGRADVEAYYRRFYTPENALLIVAGDVEPDAALEMAADVYGPIPPSGMSLDRSHPVDPPRRGRRLLIVAERSIRQPRLRRLHVVPSPRRAVPGEAEALELLAHLLAGDQTCILPRRLVVETSLATSVGAGYMGTVFPDATVFALSGTPSAGITPEQIDTALDGILAELAETGFPEADLARAKRQIVAEAVYEQDNHSALARRYGAALCCGLSHEDIALWRSRVEAVTDDDLRCALRHLDPRSAVSGHLVEATA
ncbi:zinc protease [Methylorubrum rhodinum]|uniref:Zinc protease n=1 Tax=Methylorubrum rhodinum TaxID=29428 RepID=A0A840ZHL4_9HYPH|nr:pitrilysin family protein [Methylorubrum rhodinum]MBB5756491.1 zinc protease [Methylorubrum rhodinum]